MSDKAQRRFWRLHLSSAVGLMFIASLAVLLNERPSIVPLPDQWDVTDGEDDSHTLESAFKAIERKKSELSPRPGFYIESRGCPFPFYECSILVGGDYREKSKINYVMLLIDIGVTLAVLFSVAFISESIIRRREARSS